MPPDIRPTQSMVAKAAGVSQMSVSLALRNHPSLPRATRERIQSVARRMGYRPNPMLSALMKELRMRRHATMTATLAYVTSFPTRDSWRTRPLWQRFYDGVCERAERLGYRVEEFWLREPGMTGRRLSRILYSRSIQAVVIAPPPIARGHITLEWDRFSASTIGWALLRPSLHRAVNHQLHSLSLAIRQLKRLGYRRIGLALSREIDARADNNWAASVLLNRLENGANPDWPMLVTPEWSRETFLEWLDKRKPDVVLSSEIDALHWIEQSGLRVPENIGFAPLEWTDVAPYCAGIRQNSRLVGAAAVDLAVEQLEHNERGLPDHPKVVMIEGQWIGGATVRDSRPHTRSAKSGARRARRTQPDTERAAALAC